jgi:hypothetical protein
MNKLLFSLVICAAAAFAQPKPATLWPVKDCIGMPGNTTGHYRQQCQGADGTIFACKNTNRCDIATDWRLIGPISTAGNLLYYLQNSVVASGTYTSGGSFTGSVGATCIVTITNGGGSGATATVALTGPNAIAGGTALVITAGGMLFTSAPTSATLTRGTATACSGTIVIATVLNVPISDVSGASPALATPYNPKNTSTYTMTTGTKTTTLQTWVTSSGVPGIAFIPAGLLDCHIHVARTTKTGSSAVQCVFQEVDSSGAFIATIGTTEPSADIPTVETEADMDLRHGERVHHGLIGFARGRLGSAGANRRQFQSGQFESVRRRDGRSAHFDSHHHFALRR